jgi:hypothetical protein
LLKKPLGTITWAYNNAIEKVRRKMGWLRIRLRMNLIHMK